MRKRLLILFVAIPAISAISDEFMIHDSASETSYGPFEFIHGEILTIGGRAYELRRTNTKADRLIERMKSIIIPRIEFRDAAIRDVVAFMMDASEAADPDSVGVNIILSRIPDHKPVDKSTYEHAWDESPWGHKVEADDVSKRGTISLNLRRVSLYDALSIIAEVSGIDYRIDERGVVFLDERGIEIETP